MGALLLYCRFLVLRAFSGAQVLSLQSAQGIVHFPFPSRGEPGLGHPLTGNRDGFKSLATRDTAVHEQQLVGVWFTLDTYFLIGSRKRVICSVAMSIILRSSCPSMFMQAFSFHGKSCLENLPFKQAGSFLVLLILCRENTWATLPLNHQTSAFQAWTFISKELMNDD